MDQIFDLLALTETASRENMASVADEVEELQAELRERPYPACLSESRRLADEAIDQLVLALEAFAADEPNWKELMDEGQVMLVKVRWENERVLEEEVAP
jgi:hypothetical protein